MIDIESITNREKGLKPYLVYYFVSFIVIFSFIFLLVFLIFVSKPIDVRLGPTIVINVNTCGYLNNPNTNYVISSDINAVGDCIFLNASNVVLNASLDYVINGDFSGNYNGVVVLKDDVVIMGLNITGFGNGIYVNSSDNVTFENVTTTNSTYGVYLDSSNFGKLKGGFSQFDLYGVFLNGGRNNEVSNYVLLGGTGANPSLPALEGISLRNSLNNLIEKNIILFYDKAIVVKDGNSGNDLLENGIFSSNENGFTFINNSGPNSLVGGSANSIGEAGVYIEDSEIHIENLNVGNVLQSGYELKAGGNFDNKIHLKNTSVGSYLFLGNGSRIIFSNDYGKIEFEEKINGSGSNFSSDVSIKYNFAFVDSDNNNGLNKSANISLYSIPSIFQNPVIFRNHRPCSSNVCSRFTSLVGSNVLFNVAHWTNYSIGEGGIIPIINILKPDEGDVYTNNSFPIVFRVDINMNGNVKYTINNGVSNVSMTSLNNRSFISNVSALSLGNYTFIAYASFVGNNTLLQDSVNFRVVRFLRSGQNNNSNNQNNSQNFTNQQNQINSSLNNSGGNFTTGGNNVGASGLDTGSVVFWLFVSILVTLIIIVVIVFIRKVRGRKFSKINVSVLNKPNVRLINDNINKTF